MQLAGDALAGAPLAGHLDDDGAAPEVVDPLAVPARRRFLEVEYRSRVVEIKARSTILEVT